MHAIQDGGTEHATQKLVDESLNVVAGHGREQEVLSVHVVQETSHALHVAVSK